MSANGLHNNADTIASGAALGTAGIYANGTHPVGITMPAGWDAAVLTFQQSSDGTTWANMYDQNGAEVTVQAAAGRFIALPPTLIGPVEWLRVRSGTSAVPVNQTASRAIGFKLKQYGGSN